MASLAYLVGLVGGALVITFLLTRLSNAILRKLLKNHNLVYIVSFIVVVIICLIFAASTMKAEALIYMPAVAVWLLYDLLKGKKPKATSVSSIETKGSSPIMSKTKPLGKKNLIVVIGIVIIGILILYLYIEKEPKRKDLKGIDPQRAELIVKEITKNIKIPPDLKSKLSRDYDSPKHKKYKSPKFRSNITKSPYLMPYYRSGDCESGHWIESVSSDGKFIILEDDSLWEVDGINTIDSSLWLPTSDVIVCSDKIINIDSNETVSATRQYKQRGYRITTSYNDEFFIINSEIFKAKTFCFDMQESDEILFLEGSPFGACASAKLLNLRTNKVCEVWCE